LIDRLFFKNLVTFKEIDIEFKKGLIVLSGPSGAILICGYS